MKHRGCICKLVFFCLGIVPFLTRAQVTINAQLPPGGMVQKEQLWNLILVNNREDNPVVNIKLALQDALTGQLVMSANTSDITLGKGVKILTSPEIQPVLYNYNSPDLSGTFLPIGSYTACYQIYRILGESEEPLGSECINFQIDPLSPPLLNSPEDKSKIPTPYPSFTWMPPTPVNMFSDLSYDIIITEVLGGQSPAEAVETNVPVYNANNLVRPNENYPGSFMSLEADKVYAWQVIARNGLSYAVKTDVWTFTIDQKNDPVVIPENVNYILLENGLNDIYIITNKQLHFKYGSFDIEHETPIIFSDLNENRVFTINKKITQGDNYFDINLDNRFKKGNVYSVTIIDLKGNSHLIKFSFK